MSLPSLALVLVIAAAIVMALIQLGALSVWVAVLSLSLKFVSILLIGTVLFFLWQRFKRN